MQGWNNDTTYGPFGGMGFQDSSAVTVETTMQELGMPVMEIFVRRDSNGKLQRQACVVREADKQGDADGDASIALDLLSGGAPPSSCTISHTRSKKHCFNVLPASFPFLFHCATSDVASILSSPWLLCSKSFLVCMTPFACQLRRLQYLRSRHLSGCVIA